MSKNEQTWWTKGDSLYGGETFEITESDPGLRVKKGDVFRIEKAGRTIRLIPHPLNKGIWKGSYDKNNPIKLKEQRPTNKLIRRILSMKIKLPRDRQKTFFLQQLMDGTILLKMSKPNDPRHNGGSASVRR